MPAWRQEKKLSSKSGTKPERAEEGRAGTKFKIALRRCELVPVDKFRLFLDRSTQYHVGQLEIVPGHYIWTLTSTSTFGARLRKS
jgi:hypothetical protein